MSLHSSPKSTPPSVRTPEISAPEPGLSPQKIIARAQALTLQVREQQEEAERLGHHTEALEREFVSAGLYRILQPRLFGGYEFDLPTFWKAMLAVAEGDPGTGWGLTLGAHHALVLGAHFPAAGQRSIFGPAGDFRCPHRPVPAGTAKPADGGFVVSGTWDYCSGIAHATHFMGNALIAGRESQGRSAAIAVVIPKDQVTVLDDWGDGVTLGMNSSGSNSVRADEVFVPAQCTSPGDWTRRTEPAPGAELHGNPMYCGRIYAVYHGGLVVPLIGAARAALAESSRSSPPGRPTSRRRSPGTPTRTTSGSTATPWPSPTRPRASCCRWRTATWTAASAGRRLGSRSAARMMCASTRCCSRRANSHGKR